MCVAVSREGFVLFFLDLESGEVKEERLGLLCFGWLCIRFVPHRIFRGGFFFFGRRFDGYPTEEE